MLNSKYKVYRMNGQEVQGFFVLRPERDPLARECISLYASKCQDPVLSQALSDWMKEFNEFKCVDPTYMSTCRLTQSPVCCAHCQLRQDCYGTNEQCKLVETGEINHVTECKHYNKTKGGCHENKSKTF